MVTVWGGNTHSVLETAEDVTHIFACTATVLCFVVDKKIGSPL